MTVENRKGNDPIHSGLGTAYEKDDGTLGMIRCFVCGKENYSPSVNTGCCAWCGYDCNKEISDRLEEMGNKSDETPSENS